VNQKPKALANLDNKPGSKKRKIQSALNQIQSEKDKLESMGPIERQEEEKRLALDRAMQKAYGIKQKTDANRLKKTLRDTEKKKLASKQRWANLKGRENKKKL